MEKMNRRPVKLVLAPHSAVCLLNTYLLENLF